MNRVPSASPEPAVPTANPDGSVRAARQEDAAAIAAVHVASWRVAYRGHLPDDYLDSRSEAVRTRAWRSTLAGPAAAHVLVSVLGTRVVGFAQAGPSGDADAPANTGELVTLYLHPDVWGLGLGRDLQERALIRLAADGYRSVTLWMLSTNDRARRFYLRQGWSPIDGQRVQEFGGRAVIDHRFHRMLADPAGPGEPV